MSLRAIYLFGFVLYIALCVSFGAIYCIIKAGFKEQRVRFDYFFCGLASWIPVIIASLFI